MMPAAENQAQDQDDDDKRDQPMERKPEEWKKQEGVQHGALSPMSVQIWDCRGNILDAELDSLGQG
jgi:hypothetical protein